jgi:hypothetical protein
MLEETEKGGLSPWQIYNSMLMISTDLFGGA